MCVLPRFAPHEKIVTQKSDPPRRLSSTKKKKRAKRKPKTRLSKYHSSQGFAKETAHTTLIVFVVNVNVKIDMKLNHVEATGAQIGVLNQGSIRDVRSIDVTIGNLSSAGQQEISKAFKELTDAVVAAKDFKSETDRQELLEQIEELGVQATKMPGERKLGIVKATFNALATTASAFGGLASVWATWGPVIQKFFGL